MTTTKYFSLIEIEINHSCNLACSYCPNAEHKRIETGEMDTDLFKKLMKQLAEIDYDGLVSFHFYNEPLLCSKLDLFVGLLRDMVPKARLQLYSNGLFINYKRFRELVDLGVNYFCITRHEGIKEDFAFQKTLDQLTPEELKKVIFHNYKQIELNNRGGLLPHLNNEKKDFSKFPCQIAQMFTVVTLKGNVLPCYEDFYQKEIMGNINDTHIKEIWESEHYKNFRRELKSKRSTSSSKLCQNCDNFTVVSDDW